MGSKKNKIVQFLPYVISIVFLLITLSQLNDYGLNIDSKKNFLEGDENLNYILGKKINISNLFFQMHGAFFLMISSLSSRILFDQFHLIDEISSRFVVLPILVSLFVIPLYFFLKKHFGYLVAMISVLSLLSFPEFFGFVFNNLKDIPLLVFLSLSIMSFYEWVVTKKIKFLYLFFLALGLALSIKIYAIVVVPILFLWGFMMSSNKIKLKALVEENRAYFLIGLLTVFLLVAVLYMPAFWGMENKADFINRLINDLKDVSVNDYSGWNYYSFMLIFFKTPLPMLFFAFIGLSLTFKKRRKSLFLLLLLWMLIPALILCMPKTCRYFHGLRLFLVFIVPFSVIASIGFKRFYVFVLHKTKLNKQLCLVVLVFSLLFGNIFAIASTHPYETLYFNELIGGLGGAQKNKVISSFDYWLTSYKEAGAWINKNAAPLSTVSLFYVSFYPFDLYNFFNLYLSRKDIEIKRFFQLESINTLPSMSYIVYIPLDQYRYMVAENQLKNSFEYKPVYKVSRQGGEILTIYYKM